MPMVLYTAEKPLKASERAQVEIDRSCIVCGSHLLRLAEREQWHPYHWMPCGYVCSSCNRVFQRVGV
jgi:hypothetical protein